MSISSTLGAFSLVLFQSTTLWWTTFVWPIVAIAIACLIVYSQWGRNVKSIDVTKWVKLERQVTDTADKTEQHGKQLTVQQQQLEDQQRLLETLVQDVARYSISDYIFYLLVDLDKVQKTTGEYLYRRDGTMWRNLRFLMDHGYIEEVYPEPADKMNLRDIVRITPAGHSLIALREQRAAA
jgi:hypothetical protein